jgi:hypothetical protein
MAFMTKVSMTDVSTDGDLPFAVHLDKRGFYHRVDVLIVVLELDVANALEEVLQTN